MKKYDIIKICQQKHLDEFIECFKYAELIHLEGNSVYLSVYKTPPKARGKERAKERCKARGKEQAKERCKTRCKTQGTRRKGISGSLRVLEKTTITKIEDHLNQTFISLRIYPNKESKKMPPYTAKYVQEVDAFWNAVINDAYPALVQELFPTSREALESASLIRNLQISPPQVDSQEDIQEGGAQFLNPLDLFAESYDNLCNQVQLSKEDAKRCELLFDKLFECFKPYVCSSPDSFGTERRGFCERDFHYLPKIVDVRLDNVIYLLPYLLTAYTVNYEQVGKFLPKYPEILGWDSRIENSAQTRKRYSHSSGDKKMGNANQNIKKIAKTFSLEGHVFQKDTPLMIFDIWRDAVACHVDKLSFLDIETCKDLFGLSDLLIDSLTPEQHSPKSPQTPPDPPASHATVSQSETPSTPQN